MTQPTKCSLNLDPNGIPYPPENMPKLPPIPEFDPSKIVPEEPVFLKPVSEI